MDALACTSSQAGLETGAPQIIIPLLLRKIFSSATPTPFPIGPTAFVLI
ncbi:hypothetical protein Cflav_PD5325 [Pedosphaera parvula Ellin514]|uniref:Uncharacterized protein n=1 Tax=Pedosphaera parvula (strain Ellin514) TaxID=320771 RepID=B9XCM2_PEDPL|nr:hypothetical protein Cflav_PD5325 [Pedosphaera parvula Ellin514]